MYHTVTHTIEVEYGTYAHTQVVITTSQSHIMEHRSHAQSWHKLHYGFVYSSNNYKSIKVLSLSMGGVHVKLVTWLNTKSYDTRL